MRRYELHANKDGSIDVICTRCAFIVGELGTAPQPVEAIIAQTDHEGEFHDDRTRRR